MIIIFYTFINKYIGLFVCIIVILFYNYDNKESFDFIDDVNVENIENVEYIEDQIYLDIHSKKDVKIKMLKEKENIIMENKWDQNSPLTPLHYTDIK